MSSNSHDRTKAEDYSNQGKLPSSPVHSEFQAKKQKVIGSHSSPEQERQALNLAIQTGTEVQMKG